MTTPQASQPSAGSVTAGTAPTEYQIVASSRPGAAATVKAADTTIDFDGSWGGSRSGLPGPAELLASAFAACLLKNLARSSALLAFRHEGAEVEVTARRQDSPPLFVEITYTLRITTDESRHRVDLMHANLRRFGTVYNTLAAVCDVHGEVVAVAPEPDHDEATDRPATPAAPA